MPAEPRKDGFDLVTLLSTAPAGLSRTASAGPTPDRLLLHNLLNDLDTLSALLVSESQRRSWLNAYLLAAGMNQIAEDELHADPFSARKVAKHLRGVRRPVGPLGAGAAIGAAAGLHQARLLRAQATGVLSWQRSLSALVELLACTVTLGQTEPCTEPDALAEAQRLREAVSRLPAGLRRAVMRLPACFRSFDQQIADQQRLVERFVQRWPERRRSLLVVGVRTSGSYLAPLIAALLRSAGFGDVSCLTWRSGQRALPSERAALQTLRRNDGLLLLTDDPPSTGRQLAVVAEELRQIGLDQRSLILLLQLFGPEESLPACLRDFASVLLPYDEWSAHELLTPAAVREALAELVAPQRSVEKVQPLPLPPSISNRAHVRARFSARLTERETGETRDEQIYVKGAGLGYFGDHSLAVATALPRYMPEIYGVRHGLLFRRWLPESSRLTAGEASEVASAVRPIARYVLERSRSLPVGEDISLRLADRHPIWQCASDLLSPAFGAGAPLVRPLLHRLARRLLPVESPSVLDSHMALSRWFRERESGNRLVKLDFDERAFCTFDLACYDPVYDLAGAAAGSTLPQLADQLRSAFQYEGGCAISEERWLLYRLLRLREIERDNGRELPEIQHALASAMHEYFARTYLQDEQAPTNGPLCAIDIDGVFETPVLGFSATTPAGCLAVRALLRHGYQPVLATGRSLEEVRERCAAYHFAGGVAEYGAVIYDHRTGAVLPLLTEMQRADLSALRAALEHIDGVSVDQDYSYAVRAYCLDGEGRRRRLSADIISAALARSGVADRIRAIDGWSQTDFMTIGVDKGTGLLSLVEELGRQGGRDGATPVAWAIGDTVSDLPMFALAETPFAPANGDLHARSAARVTKASHQAAIAEAVGRLLGHRPGRCPVCRPPALSRDARLLTAVLAAQDTGKPGKLRRALQLTAQLCS